MAFTPDDIVLVFLRRLDERTERIATALRFSDVRTRQRLDRIERRAELVAAP
jgi:hypothetical protein